MISLFSSGAVHLRDLSLSFILRPPEIQLANEETLILDPQIPPTLSEEETGVTTTYHWRDALGRQFLGTAHLHSAHGGYIWQVEVAPVDGLGWGLASTSEGSGCLSGWQNATELQLFHADNVRGATQDVFLMDGSYWVSMEDWRRPLNIGRWQSFPGLWLFDPARKMGFVCGVLSQQTWKHSLHGQVIQEDRVELCGQFFPPGIAARSLGPGEAYRSEPLYFEITAAEIPARAFAGYLNALSSHLKPCKATSYLADRAFWDSWNDRRPHFWDVSMDLLRRTRETLQNHFPTVTSLEVDDGYAFAGFQNVQADIWTRLEHGLTPTKEAQDFQRVRRLGVAFAYEEDYATARDRFPDGVGAAATEMKAAGFLPAIWLGLNIVHDARLVLEKPEWMIKYHSQPGDDPELARIFSGDSSNRLQVLDPSLPEVRDYYQKVFEILFREWGYEALKLDFWTYAFENDSFRLKCPDQTALELRQWLFASIRRYLPQKSFLVACCDISTGNPFFSQWVDTIRYGIDIGNGKWESIRYSALTGTFLLHVEAWRFYFLNPDSIGALKGLPANERRCFLSWCAVTRSLCEMAGDLALLPEGELRALQKLLLAPKNGLPVRLGEFSHLSCNEPAAIVFAEGDLFSRQDSPLLPCGILAVFNWSDEPRSIAVSTEALGLAAGKQWWDADFFEEGLPVLREDTWQITLPPRSVRLSHLSEAAADQVAILDSHWAIEQTIISRKSLQVSAKGNAPKGFLLYWPFSTPLKVLSSSLPFQTSSLTDNFYQVMPTLTPQAGTCDWTLALALKL